MSGFTWNTARRFTTFWGGYMQIGQIQYVLQGDIGGAGVTRFSFVSATSTDLTGTDVSNMVTYTHSLLSSCAPGMAGDVNWTLNPEVPVYEVDTGLVQAPFVVTSVPSVINGGGSGSYAAGTGARLNWKTNTILGRRLMRGATYLVPLDHLSFTPSGGVISSYQTTVNTAALAYLTSVKGNGLYPVTWHRPPKGTHAGGIIGILTAGVCSGTPSGLRSRRS